AVHQVVAEALERARSDKKMTIVETVSMRLQGHSVADPFTEYVPADQLAAWASKDPIRRLREHLIREELAHLDQLIEIEQSALAEVDAAALEAEAGPVPDSSDIEQRVFSPSKSTVAVHGLPAHDAGGSHISYYQAIRDGLLEEMDRDKDL